MVEKAHRLIISKLYNLQTINPIRRLLFLLIICLNILLITPVKAQSFITDDETESLLEKVVRPIFKAANIPFNSEKILILNDESLNAFVTDGNYLVIHSGTLINTADINELSGVLAHEAGHIAGGHIVRQKLQLDKMSALSVVSLIAAGAAAAASGRGDAAMAVMLGSQSSLFNAMNAYQMQEERSADESAVKYLAKLGQSPEGLKNFMKKTEQKNRLSGYDDFPYFRTHPLSSERINFFNQAVKNSKGTTVSPYDDEFKMIKAKISAFLLEPSRAWRLYPLQRTENDALYAHAILYYRQSDINKALQTLEKLLAKEPQNPFFHELKGQFLFESGRLPEAVESYTQALRLRNSPEIALGWAQAALEAPHDKAVLGQIINTLNKITIKEYNAVAWLLLARAYEENGQKAHALYASARYNTGLGNFEAAAKQLTQAEKNSPSPELKLKIADLKDFIGKKQKD